MRRLHLTLLRVYGRLPRRVRRAAIRVVAPKYTAGVVCLVRRGDGRVLLVRHSYRQRWGTPGGLMDRGEEPAAAVVRETAEETGLAVEAIEPPTVVVDPQARRIDIVYDARLLDGADPDSARPCSVEIAETSWFAPDDLPVLQQETASALRAAGLTT
ncbi:MAG: NUDIX hydrolase, partial [Acidimicrobiales bacterium]